MRVSVVLPTYNEQECILALLREIHAALGPFDHEIVLVDDNSPDGTFRTVSDAALPFVRAVLRTHDPGLANSVRCGLESASGDLLVVMDSDFNHQPRYLPFMVRSLSDYECVTASRYLYGGRMNNRARHLLSWIFNVFVRFVTGGQIMDNLYGFYAIRRATLERLPFDDIFWGYGDYFIRLLYYLQRNGADILQIPAVNGERGGGRGNSSFVRMFLLYTFETMKFAFSRRRHV